MLALVVATAVAILLWIAPAIAKRLIERSVRESCPACEFSIESLRLGLFPTRLTAAGVHYKADPSEFVVLTADLPRLRGRIALRSLVRRSWLFDELAAEAPRVEVLEKDPKPFTPPTPDSFPLGLPPFAVSTVSVADGQFTYVHRQHAKDAVIHVSDIAGTGRNFTTRPGLGSSKTTFEVESRLEQSGAAFIRAGFDLLAHPNDDGVDITVQHLPLREMNPYFVKDSGTQVDGTLDEANAALEIKQGVLTGRLRARYHRLQLKDFATAERSSLEAFFAEKLQKLKIAETRDLRHDPGVPFRVKRPNDSGIIKFMLAGLEPAAKTILTTSP